MPKKKKPEICLVENCGNTVFPGMEFCPIHGLVDMAVEGAQKAFKKGNVWDAIFNSAAAIALESGGPMVKPAMMGAAARFAQGQARKQAPPRPRAKPNGLDPWKVLGLDKSKATKKDIKEVQRHFATFYHPDKGRAVNPEVLQQVNAAAEACLKEIGSR
jgi:hypothetical protein